MQDQIADAVTPAGGETQKAFDIWAYLQVLRKRKWHALFFLAAVVGLVTFYTLRQPKVYRATATVQIDPQAPRVLGEKVEAVTEMGTGSYWSNQEYYETQYHIIRSFEVASRVVALHSLGANRTFLGVPEDLDVYEPLSDAMATEMLRGMIVVDPVKDSRLVAISVDHTDQGLAQLLSNAVADAYVEYNRDVALESTVNARDWLIKQAETWAKTLRDAEQRAVDFRKINNLLSVNLEDQRNQVANEMDWVAQRLSETRSHRLQLEAKKAEIEEQVRKRGVTSVSIAEVLASPVLQTMKARLFEKNLERDSLAQIAAENWPEMRQRDTELETIRTGIRQEVQTILRAIDADYTETAAYEQQLVARQSELQEQAIALGGKELTYTQLVREKENAERIYQLINNRSEETTLSTELSQINNVRVLDPALRPEVPIRPRVKLNLALAIVIGLLGGIGLAFLLEALDTSVKTQEDVEKGLGLAFLGIIPTFTGEASSRRRRRRRRKHRAPELRTTGHPDLFCHDNPKSSAAECCRSIRTNILFMSPDRPPRKLLVTSASPQEGKTTVAISLAITMAQSGSRVLIVDSDMRRPRVHTAFGLENEDGLSTAILGMRKVEELVRPTQVPGLDILTCGPIPPNPAELIHTERFKEVVAQLERLYDRVVFDSPPIIAVTDPVILSRHVDGAILVVKSMVTNRRAAKFAVKQMRDVGGNILGAVLNDLDLENREYGYYHYYYYRKYGYYYGAREDEAKKSKSGNGDDQAGDTNGDRAPPPAAPGS
ncbi:MAG: polysaccharide biosynthesis tyrosine autokinase [Deltaproteobacteria bacterium]|nr:polysaccharide biosynthesis tyrosine autokinase [Deltaproteobacteria bacterium]